MPEEYKFRYKTYNHAKTRLRYHIVFSTKYRRKCLNNIKEEVFNSFKYCCKISHIKILAMALDNDHIHFLVEFPPKYSIEQTVKRMKTISTKYLYDRYREYLKKFYWGEKNIIWTHGYFCSTIGEVSESTIKEYINNQG